MCGSIRTVFALLGSYLVGHLDLHELLGDPLQHAQHRIIFSDKRQYHTFGWLYARLLETTMLRVSWYPEKWFRLIMTPASHTAYRQIFPFSSPIPLYDRTVGKESLPAIVSLEYSPCRPALWQIAVQIQSTCQDILPFCHTTSSGHS